MPSHTPQFLLALLIVALLCAAPAYGAFEGVQYLGVEDIWLLRAAAAGGLAVGMIVLGLLYCLTELKEVHKKAALTGRSLGLQFVRSWLAAIGVLFVLILMFGPAVITFLATVSHDTPFISWMKTVGVLALSIAVVGVVSYVHFWFWTVPRNEAKRAAQRDGRDGNEG